MRDALHSSLQLLFILVGKIILKDEVTSKRENQMLKNVNWGLTSQQENMLLKESTLSLCSFHTLFDSLHLRCILEVTRFTLFVFILTLLEELASTSLHVSHFISLVDLVANRHLRKWIG